MDEDLRGVRSCPPTAPVSRRVCPGRVTVVKLERPPFVQTIITRQMKLLT
jgi:hypothetical protein